MLLFGVSRNTLETCRRDVGFVRRSADWGRVDSAVRALASWAPLVGMDAVTYRDEPATPEQLTAALIALGVYSGKGDAAEHAGEAKRLGANVYRMQLATRSSAAPRWRRCCVSSSGSRATRCGRRTASSLSPPG